MDVTQLLGQLQVDDILLTPEQCIKHLNEFNCANENSFTFTTASCQPDSDTFSKLATVIRTHLSVDWSQVVRTFNANSSGGSSSEQALEPNFTLRCNLFVACLNAIRLLSRDKAVIYIFETEPLLIMIQKMASLFIVNETANSESSLLQSTSVVNCDMELVTLAALKSISNLIYNSKFIQEFYIRNGVAETITICLKQFNPVEAFNGNALNHKKINIMLFNLRILFLLTALNKDLRMKLREKLQVITYLIEIIDQIMKERLNEDIALLNSELAEMTRAADQDASSLAGDQLSVFDFCYLKSIDIDFINEILKILYNLTIDITSTVNSGNTALALGIRTAHSEEDEAHLMHLVSVLRDLVTCRLEEEYDLIKSTNKLKMLHSNIINLITNMPNICYEELMTPSIVMPANNSTLPSSSRPSNKLFKQISNISLRLAHNKKRLSRRSKRITKKKHDSINKSSHPTIAEYNSLLLITSDEDLEFDGKNMEALIIILEYLNHHVSSYLNMPNDANCDLLYPILLLLSLMVKSNRTIRHYYKFKVLPLLNKQDLVNLPESGSQLRNKLVRLMTNPNLQIKRLSAQFLFILCKENVSRLIKYTGFGNAAGLLADAGLMLSSGSINDRSSYSSDSEDSDSEDYKKLEGTINQVTGKAEIEDKSALHYDQKSDKYFKLKKDIFEGMTEEQKEHEAIQLVNAIDKLSKIGGIIRPATIGEDGRPVEIQHVLQLQDAVKSGLVSNDTVKKLTETNESDDK